jgi:hypothetical protein
MLYFDMQKGDQVGLAKLAYAVLCYAMVCCAVGKERMRFGRVRCITEDMHAVRLYLSVELYY